MSTRARERILFVELWRLGDAVSATAGLRSLREARPEAEIAVLAHSRYGEPLFRSPDADRQLRFDAFWTRGRTPRDKYVPWTIDFQELARAARALRDFHPDHVLLFRGDIREQLFFRALGLRHIVDLRGPHPVLPTTKTHRRPTGGPRWQEYVFHVQQWAHSSAAAEPHIAGIVRPSPALPYVLLHPGASWRYKQWSADHVAALLEWLQARGTAVRLVAGPEDRDFMESLRRATGHDLRVEHPSLPELYALAAGAQLVICNNSAMLHIAEALDTPCIALTGPSDPVRWGTYRRHSRTLVRSTTLTCHPCGDKRCVLPRTPCIDRIALIDVIEAIQEMELPGVPLRLAASI